MEKTIENGLIRIARAAGGLAVKFVSPGTAGMPDRLVLLPGGRIIFVELKEPGKKLRQLQQYRKKQLEALGFKSLIIDSKEKLEALRHEIHSS